MQDTAGARIAGSGTMEDHAPPHVMQALADLSHGCADGWCICTVAG